MNEVAFIPNEISAGSLAMSRAATLPHARWQHPPLRCGDTARLAARCAPAKWRAIASSTTRGACAPAALSKTTKWSASLQCRKTGANFLDRRLAHPGAGAGPGAASPCPAYSTVFGFILSPLGQRRAEPCLQSWPCVKLTYPLYASGISDEWNQGRFSIDIRRL